MTKMKTPAGEAAIKSLEWLGYDDNATLTLDTLADLRELAVQVDMAMWHQVEVLHGRGLSQTAIATAMGVSKQAVQKQLARRGVAQH